MADNNIINSFVIRMFCIEKNDHEMIENEKQDLKLVRCQTRDSCKSIKSAPAGCPFRIRLGFGGFAPDSSPLIAKMMSCYKKKGNVLEIVRTS